MARKTCPQCGTKNLQKSQFCSHCGFQLTNTGTTNAMPTVVSPSSPQQTMISASGAPTVAVSPGTARRITGALPQQALIGGRYRIIHLVGKGGFGAVYEATDEHFQARRAVAIKEMSDAQLNPTEKITAMQNFRREADLLVPLKHPNLPNVSDFFEEGGKAYLVMEFVEGKTLEKELEDHSGPLDERRVMNWAMQLCAVLSYLHRQPQPIIFRDMKPANVMVTSTDQIKLIDFGIARVFKASSKKDTELLGSRDFASPEQFGLGQTDARSDIYSLGATLYDLLTDSEPLNAPARLAQPGLFQNPRQLNPRISATTEAIILKALSIKAQDRYQTTSEMAQAILGNTNPQQQVAQAFAQAPTLVGAGGTAGQVGNAGGQPQNPPSPPAPAGGKSRTSGLSRRSMLTGLGIAAVAVVAGGYALTRMPAQSGGATPTAGPVLPLNFVYSTEKEQWLTAAIEAFAKSSAATYQGRTIQLQPQASGSLDLAQGILRGDMQPAAWSPASSLEIDQLNSQWQQKHAGQDILVRNDIQSLVLSPLVFAIWEDRAKVLLNQYHSIDWNSIYQALQLPNGWADIGGSPDWQHVKLGQTRADVSNSGLLSLVLMAYSYFKKTQGLTVANINDPGFIAYCKTFEDAVNAFGRSSGTYLEQDVLVKGPAAYEIIPTYENLVLTSQDEVKQRQPQRLLPAYSSANILSDHPFVFLKGSWVSQEQQAAARQFRDFLLATPQQQLALQYGLRPTNPDVHITDKLPHNLFLTSDIHTAIHSNFSSVQLPSDSVVQALISLWVRNYGGAATANG